jgi:hypothetical protein
MAVYTNAKWNKAELGQFNTAWSYDQNNRLFFLNPKKPHPCDSFGVKAAGVLEEVYFRGKHVIDAQTVPALLLATRIVEGTVRADYVLNPANFIIVKDHPGYKGIPDEEVKGLKAKHNKDACTWFKALFTKYLKHHQPLLNPDVVHTGVVQAVTNPLNFPRLLANYEGSIMAQPSWTAASLFGDNAEEDETQLDVGGPNTTPSTASTASAPGTPVAPTPNQQLRVPPPTPSTPYSIVFTQVKNKRLEQKRLNKRRIRLDKREAELILEASGIDYVYDGRYDDEEDDQNVSDADEDEDFKREVALALKKHNEKNARAQQQAAADKRKADTGI